MPTIRYPRHRVEVAGLARRCLDASTNVGARTAVAAATVRLHPDDGFVDAGASVRLWMGYGAGLTLVFSGTVDEEGIDYAPNAINVSCSGALLATQRALGKQDTSLSAYANDDGTFPAAAWESITDGALVSDILTRLYGVTQVNIADSGTTLATLAPIVLQPDDNGWRLIDELDRLLGYKTFDAPDGTVLRIPWSGVPSGTASLTLTEGVNVKVAQRKRSRSGIYNLITCRGLPGITGSTGIPFQPTAQRFADSPYVPDPPRYQAEPDFQTPLAETAEVCDAYCARRLGELNRLQETCDVDLIAGDASLRPGATLAVVSARLGYDAAMRFRVEQVQQRSGLGGFQTHLGVLGAYASDGFNPNQRPIAQIAAKLEREQLDDGSTLVVAYLDGSGSYDPDGTLVNYAWTGSPVTPTATNKGLTANAIYTGDIPSGATVALTVTDDQGATGSQTLALDDPSFEIFTRDLWLAVSSDLLFSLDGQVTWQSAGVAAVGCARQASDTYQLAWTSGGDLYKVTAATPPAPTAALTGKGVTSVWIGYTFARGFTGVCYAGCSNGDIYRSADGGATWARMGAPTAAAIGDLQESAYAEGELSCVAGPSLWHSFDAGASWTAQYTHPNTALTAVRVTTGFGQGWVAFSGTAAVGEASRIQERNDLADLDVPGAAKPITPTGLALALTEDRLYLTDVDSGGDGRTWTAAADASGTFDQGAWDQATYGAPNDLMRDGAIPGLIFVAADKGLIKSPDEFATNYVSKALASPQVGKMIGIGALRRTTITPTTIVSTAGAEKVRDLWNGGGNDAAPLNWWAPGYSDADWDASSLITGTGVAPMAGTEAVWAAGATSILGRQVLLRRAFTLPAGTLSSASFAMSTVDPDQHFWINGVEFTSAAGTASGAALIAALHAGANELAILGNDTLGNGNPEWTSYRLDVS